MSKLEVVEIDISKIDKPENYRARIGELDELMMSIKSNGLLQPIGVQRDKTRYKLAFGYRRVAAAKKLGMKKILAVVLPASQNRVLLNIVENLQREDTPMYEIGRAIHFLTTKEGLSRGEVAVRIGTNKAYIKRAIDAFNLTPPEYRGKVISMDAKKTQSKDKGLISSTVSSLINNTASRYKLNKKQIDSLYKMASKKQMSNAQGKVICSLMARGLTVDQAMENVDKVKIVRADVMMSTEEYDRMITKYGKGWVQKIMDAQTVDKIKPISKAKILKRTKVIVRKRKK